MLPPLPPKIAKRALTTVCADHRMEPHRVDEFMRAAWGHIYTQKDAEDHVKRTKQMLAKVGDADSSVDNAAKVEPPGALPMAYDGAHPKESAMAPEEIRAELEKYVSALLRQRSSSNEARSSSGRWAECVFAGLGSVASARSWARASVDRMLRAHGSG